MSLPLPPSISDEEACRIFIADFADAFPSLSSQLHEHRTELLHVYLRKGLTTIRDFHAEHEVFEVDSAVLDCLSLLEKEQYDALSSLAETVAVRYSTRNHVLQKQPVFPFAGVMSFAAVCCGLVSAMLIGVFYAPITITNGLAIALSCLSSLMCAIGTRSLATHARIIEDNRKSLDDLMTEALTASTRHAVNPLSVVTTAQTHFGEGDEQHPTLPASSFLIEPDEALQRKAQIDAILLETDDDDGQIIVRTRGFSKVSVALAALSKHMLLVITDMDGKVIYWSDGAAWICGFSARDAEGKHISSFLFGDKSQQFYDKMTVAAINGIEASAKLLSVANLTFGSVPVRASVVMAKSSERDSPIGFVLLASSQESDSMRGVSQFHQYFVSELLHDTAKSDPKRRSLECLQWKNLHDLAVASRDWTSVMLQNVLSDVVKDRHRQVDVRVQPNVQEAIVCDQGGVTRSILQILQLLVGKVRIQVSQRRCTDVIQQLVVQFFHSSPPKLEAVEDIQRNVADLGCSLDSADGMIRLVIPFVSEGGTTTGDQGRDANTTNTSATAIPPMTILLLERNAVYRHNISTIAWASGHSLRLVDSLSKALKSVNESGADFGCAIVDVDMRDAERLVEALARHKIFTIETSVSADSAAKSHTSFLVKPTNRSLLDKELERAAMSIKERKKVDEEIHRQREIFGKVRNSPWTRGRKLGRGAFADVYEATSTLTGGKMAVKMIRLVGGFKERVKDLINEIQILCSLTHPHIIHYFYCERAETTINLFMELADEGSLADLLASQSKLTEDQLALVTKHLLLAVNYLHDQGIIHRDIKPGNMLVSKGKIKLSDFGTATNSVISEGTQGTIFYMAPEVVDGNSYGKECDIWSIGCVMCECLGIKRASRMNGLLGFGVPISYPPDISPQCRDFISLCLQEDPAERPTAGSLLLHDFVVGARQESSQIGIQAAIGGPGWGGGGESNRELSVSSEGSTPSW